VDASGDTTFAGASIVDMGDGSPPRNGLPFTTLIAANAQGLAAMTLTVDTTSLPACDGREGRGDGQGVQPARGRDGSCLPGCLDALLVSLRTGVDIQSLPGHNHQRFLAFNQLCLASVLTSPGVGDSAVPSPGRAFYYLISGRNSCGEGPLGTTSVVSSGQTHHRAHENLESVGKVNADLDSAVAASAS